MNDPSRHPDRELFQAVTFGDLQALGELVNRHARGLYDFALRGSQDERQASGVVEAVFSRIRHPSVQVPSHIDFRTWLYSLCLIEVLALTNETRSSRVSTEDERFYRPTGGMDREMAHAAWQAARSLRTRDYCVLDLTLRRGLTPEEVAEAASLTRSNLYASIGRARGAFEESFAAMMLFEHGRDACWVLDEMVENAPGQSLRPALRHQIIEHSDECEACRQTLDALPPAADIYISLADVEMPEAVARRIVGNGFRGASNLPVEEPQPELDPSDAAAIAAASSNAMTAAALEALALPVDPWSRAAQASPSPVVPPAEEPPSAPLTPPAPAASAPEEPVSVAPLAEPELVVADPSPPEPEAPALAAPDDIETLSAIPEAPAVIALPAGPEPEVLAEAESPAEYVEPAADLNPEVVTGAEAEAIDQTPDLPVEEVPPLLAPAPVSTPVPARGGFFSRFRRKAPPAAAPAVVPAPIADVQPEQPEPVASFEPEPEVEAPEPVQVAAPEPAYVEPDPAYVEPEPEPVPTYIEPLPVAAYEAEEPEPQASGELLPPSPSRTATKAAPVRAQPLMWTYAILGVVAVGAIYLGVAFADALQSGSKDSGAVPLDAAADSTVGREIDCGDAPIEMQAGGDAVLVNFEEDALGGFRMKTLSFHPVSSFAEYEDLEATLENPFAIRFVAKAQDTAEVRTEEFELRIQWERQEELANSTCQLLVHVSP